MKIKLISPSDGCGLHICNTRMQEKETLVLYVYITEKDGNCVKKAEEEAGKKKGAKTMLLVTQ